MGIVFVICSADAMILWLPMGTVTMTLAGIEWMMSSSQEDTSMPGSHRSAWLGMSDNKCVGWKRANLMCHRGAWLPQN